jgi:predicted DsbA family dithiol-disulfide isomerase
VAATGAEVIWRAYQLRPEGAPVLDPRGGYWRHAWRNSVYPLAERLDVEMRLPSRQPRTRLAHEAAAWARAQGCFAPYHAALFRACFVEDRDIGETAVLAEIARGIGADARDLERALAEQRMAEEVDEDLMIGRAYGITGVPTFIIGGRALFGVQEEETLARAIKRAGQLETDPAEAAPRPLPHLPINITRK